MADLIQQVLAVQADHPLAVVHVQVQTDIDLLELAVVQRIIVLGVFSVPIGILDARVEAEAGADGHTVAQTQAVGPDRSADQVQGLVFAVRNPVAGDVIPDIGILRIQKPQ